MALYNFQKRFAPPILSGKNRHTIRAKRKRRTQPGEMLHLYTGLRQKGAQLLMRTRCTRIEEILISSDCQVQIDGVLLDSAERDQLARSDGFKDFVDMMVFWNGRRPFRGDIIHWRFPPTSHTQTREMGPCANVSAPAARSQSRAAIVSVPRNADARTTTKNDTRSAPRSAPASENARHAG